MINIESKIISYREDTNDYRLCLTREEITEINQALTKREQIRAEYDIDKVVEELESIECASGAYERKCWLDKAIEIVKQGKEQK